MIRFLNARATKPKNRRYPLSVLPVAAILAKDEETAIVPTRAAPGAMSLQVLMLRAADLQAVRRVWS